MTRIAKCNLIELGWSVVDLRVCRIPVGNDISESLCQGKWRLEFGCSAEHLVIVLKSEVSTSVCGHSSQPHGIKWWGMM